jgi:type II secretory pathway component PulC
VVKTAGGVVELRLSFAGAGQPAGTVTGPVASGSGDTEVALESNRFGKRVGDNRWVMSRESLLDYYEELKDDPERMAAIFESLKPDYKDGAIGGYYLDVEGEADFFKAAGLEQGDVIRKVNSVNMTSQARAEYFIRLFVQNNLSAVVLDVEHQGNPAKWST